MQRKQKLASPSNGSPASAGRVRESQQVATIVYQGGTIAAMLLLLGSFWVF
jgi:hypothetical protein